MSRPRRIYSETYRALLQRIKAAPHVKALNALDHSIDRHYNAGTITARELARLDTKIMERIAIKETEQ